MENNKAFVAILQNIKKIENADKIVQADVMLDGVKITQVIVGVNTLENTKIVYFDSNLCINDVITQDYPDIAKYLGKGNRVKSISLKKVMSCGLCVEVEKFYKYFKSEKDASKILNEGYSFDKIENIEICKKYIPKINIENSHVGTGKGKNKIKGIMKSRIIPSQWNFHKDTEHLVRNSFKLHPDQVLSLSKKLHGTSFIFSNCLVKKKLNWFENTFKKFKYSIVDTEYDEIYASRKVIKNGILNQDQHYYKEDIWKDTSEILAGKLYKGETVYGEVVGFTKNGSWIQKDYDYGCNLNEFKLYIYRITFTNADGIVFEYSWEQLKQRCKQLEVDNVPELYFGKAKDLFPELNINEHWNVNFIQKLKEQYLEKECTICNISSDEKTRKYLKKEFNFNKVPDEGIVVRIEGLKIESYKLKSDKFDIYQNGLKDQDVVDMEDVN